MQYQRWKLASFLPAVESLKRPGRILRLASLTAALGILAPLPHAAAQKRVTPSSLTLASLSQIGGTSTSAKVKLSTTAPSGGVTVSLSSGNPGVAAMPGHVVIPAGALWANITVTTLPVPSTTSVVLAATCNGKTASATLRVLPPSLTGVGVSPGSVPAGTSAAGTAILSGPAPAGGLAITLASSTPAVQVPSSVTVPSGAASANFAVGTASSSSSVSAVITATCLGATKSATLNVTAGAPPTPPNAPSQLVAGAAGSGQAQLGWTDNSTNEQGFEVERQTAGGTFTHIGTTGAGICVYTDNGLTAGAGYSYRVRAVNAGGASAYSNTANLTMPSAPPAGPSTPSPGVPLPPPPKGGQWYAAPNGTPTGAGTIASPWDLATALNGGPTGAEVKPGDTVWLRGGTYLGKFVARLHGAPGNPITVRGYPGEWPRIDGFATTTLAAPMDATTQTAVLADAHCFPHGGTVTIDHEQMSLLNKSGNTFTFVQRSYGGTYAASHAAGALVVLGGDNLTVGGSDAIYRDFEVLNSDPIRTYAVQNRANPWRMRGSGIWHTGPRTVLLNLVVHDAQDGIFTTPHAVNSEINGCIVYNNGSVINGQVTGHGVYGQGDVAGPHRFVDMIVFNNFNIGLKQESQNANTVGMHHDGVIAFNNRSPFGDNARTPGILVGANNGVADDCSVTNSFLYQPPGTSGTCLQFGYVGQNGKASVTNNFIHGHVSTFLCNRWSPLTVTGNTISVAKAGGVLAQLTRVSGGTELWDNNTYYGAGGGYFAVDGTSQLTFASWKNMTGYDAGSHFNTGALTGTHVFVRPNPYVPGRANVVVYNEPLATTASVDLSRAGLTNGQPFVIRNAQNYFGPPAYTGTYNSASPVISLPMTDTTVPTPIGHNVTPTSTLPEFGAFVVIPN